LQLREIEEKRRALTQVKPAAVEGPEAKAQRERDLEALKRDQEQIEQELREAAQLAKKTAPSTPAKPPQSENPQSPLAAPAPQPQGGTQAELAKVEEISGEAFLVAKDGKTPVTAGANLLFGQGLQTGGGASRIVLRFSDKTRVDLGPETSLSEIKIDSGKHLAVTQGTIRAVVAKQPKGEPLILIIPHGEAKVVGTTLRLYVDPDPKKGTRLEVEEGKVELKNLAGKTVMVESGHYAVAAVGVELVVHRSPYLSPNGSILYPGQGGSLVTAEGTWTFGGVSTDLGNYYTDLNGVAVGWAAEMEIMGGSLYCHNTVGGDWFRWQNGTWIDIGPTAPSAAPKK
jgi:ferric-dicitrate binding protein FerR (iron transport regulator)